MTTSQPSHVPADDDVLAALADAGTPPAQGILAATRGLPGAGKTSWALLKEHKERQRRAR